MKTNHPWNVSTVRISYADDRKQADAAHKFCPIAGYAGGRQEDLRESSAVQVPYASVREKVPDDHEEVRSYEQVDYAFVS